MTALHAVVILAASCIFGVFSIPLSCRPIHINEDGDKMNESQAVMSVLATEVLSQYATNDACLRRLIAAMWEPGEKWKTEDDLKVNAHSVPASQIERTFRIRLSSIPDPRLLQEDEKAAVEKQILATEDLLAYCEEHPDAGISGITFNCPDRSYGVFLGVLGQQVDTICVMVGPSIPPDIWRDTSQ